MNRTVPIALIAPALLLAGCSVSEDAETGNTEVAKADEAGDLTPEEAGLFDKLLNNGEPINLAMSQNHANGSVLTLNSIQVKPTETVVNFTAINGHTREISLNQHNKGTYILADGRQFFLVPPIENDNLDVTSGQTMTGDLVFIGAVPQTSDVQIIFNGKYGSNNDYASTPIFKFDVPLTDAAFSDDGSKKNSA